MAKEQLNNYTYGEMLVSPGYDVDFAIGTTYSVNPQALLIIPMALGLLSSNNESAVQSPICLLEGIRRSTDNFVLFCNKGGIHLPLNNQPYLSLMDNCMYEVQNPQKPLSNFHPKVWIIKETNRSNKNEQQIKVIVMSRNLTLDNNLDMTVCLTGKIGKQTIDNKKHEPLIDFLTSLNTLMGHGSSCNQHIIKDKKKKIKMVIESIRKVNHFEIDTDLFEKDGYEFIPMLFGQNLNKNIRYPESWQGTEQMTISPFIGINTLQELDKNVKNRHILVTTSGYVSKDIYDLFNRENHKIYVMKDGMTHNDIMPTDLHAKTYLVCNPKGEYGNFLFIGSANATPAAFHVNSEFIIRLQYKYGKHLVFDTFRKEFLQMDARDEESKIFETVNFPPESEEAHEISELEAFVRKYITEDFSAQCHANVNGNYDVIIKTEHHDNKYRIQIAPMQAAGYKVDFENEAILSNLTLAQLSDFYIISIQDTNGQNMDKVIKIPTEGIPYEERDIAIYKSIVDSKEKFLRYLSFILTDDIDEYLFDTEQSMKLIAQHGNNKDSMPLSLNIYEQLLKAASSNPQKFIEIEEGIRKIGKEEYTQEFLEVFKTFKEAIKQK